MVAKKKHAPDAGAKYTFVKEDLNGTSPKFDVEDGKGVGLKVKLGEEPQAETAATRFLWAAGFVDLLKPQPLTRAYAQDGIKAVHSTGRLKVPT